MKEINNEEKDNNIIIVYNSVDGNANFFDYLYQEFESQSTYRKKYEIIQSTTIMSTTMFRAIRREIIFDANLSNMNFLKLNSTYHSIIYLLPIRMVADI